MKNSSFQNARPEPEQKQGIKISVPDKSQVQVSFHFNG